MLKRAFILAASLAATASAQSPSAVGQAKGLWTDVMANIVASANDVPESLYSYRPTPEVRTFGELFGHVAGSQRMFCAIAMGEKPPAEDAVEKSARTKAALVAALKESNDYCAKAYAQSDRQAAGSVDIFGAKRTRLYALLMNATHDNEHYGNLVTYLRLNKMVPPSSKPAK